MNYPSQCDTPSKKTAWLYRYQEILRLVHNGLSHWLHKGITQDQYNNMDAVLSNLAAQQNIAITAAQSTKIAAYIKNKIPVHKEFLAESDFKAFVKNDFEPRTLAIGNEICTQRETFKQDITQEVELEDN